jgi:dienelactone hydrolase
MIRPTVLLALLLFVGPLFADGPADNAVENVRRIPKLGIEVSAADRAVLENGLVKLAAAIEPLRKSKDARTLGLLPDVEVYYKAVHDALAYQEFFSPKDIEFAKTALATGQARAALLNLGSSPWTTTSGLIVRGYVSQIDGSVQPYGLVVPESYTAQTAGKYRCDIWFHGRGETLSELNFIRDRSSNKGTFTPADTIMLHPYGRYSNAFKFAGETDVLEALASVQERYRVDEDRIAVRGFSMGGAGAWHFAVHYPDRWFAANPGAGFSETPEFLRIFQKEELRPTWWEKKLWSWYDCPGYALNLQDCPTVAYSGEIDTQKQAADVMEKTLASHGIKLTHVIGPGTKHAYEPKARLEVEQRMDSLAQLGRQHDFGDITDAAGGEFVTYTLRYNQMQWLTIDGLGEHWRPATASARILDKQLDLSRVDNVTDLTINFPAGRSPFPLTMEVPILIGKQTIKGGKTGTDRSFQASFHKVGEEWKLGKRPGDALRKQHGLQGPIDDAFMDSFIFVRPTGKPQHELPGKWVDSELTRAIEHWRRHFRGEARVKDDTAITDADIAGANLVLWGDPASNAVMAKIADKLPISWSKEQIAADEQKFPADKHALVAIYPNPLNPNRYVVLNSSFTFREYAYLNNARQVPMLPDWAIVDLTVPPNSIWPGKIAAADFFDETWKLKISPESAAGK